MKILIISDLHANFDALSTLTESYDELWVLGDLVNYGPQPRETLRFVKEQAAVVVRGNHDHAVGFGVDPRCSRPYAAMAEATKSLTEAILHEDEKAYLRSLPVRAERTAGGARFYLCHAMPSDPLFGYCPPESDRWAQEAEGISADFLLVGHTHIPSVRHVGKTVVVNPGSLGQPKTGDTRACYAIWRDGSVDLKSFSYPVNQTISRIRSLSIPSGVREELAYVLESGGSLKGSGTDG